MQVLRQQKPSDQELKSQLPSTGSVMRPPQSASEEKAEVDIAPLLGRFEIVSRRLRRRVRNAVVLSIAGAAAVTMVDVTSVLRAVLGEAETLPFAAIFASWLLYATALCAIVFPVYAAHMSRRRMYSALVDCDDVRAVGPLAEMLTTPDGDTHRATVEALTQLLPRLRVSDAALLNAEQRERLSVALRTPTVGETDLRIAILRAFERIGDADALCQVERLAGIDARTRRQRMLRRTAQACLPTLRARVEQEQASSTLLRASHAPVDVAGTLLRSVSNTAPIDAQELLQAVEIEPDRTLPSPHARSRKRTGDAA